MMNQNQNQSEEEEEDDEGSTRETLRKLLEPFGKDQIIELLKEAALKDPCIVARIAQSADSDPAHRKIFVHGLGWDATSEQVLFAFKPYGDVEDCKVVTDKSTGRAKGFGFVLFRNRAGAQKALKVRQKKIGNRMASCQLASAGPVPNHPVPDSTGRKLYVANVSPHVNPDKLRLLFANFGEIEEGPLGFDPATGKLKGFAIFVYKSAEGCKKALEEPIKLFEGCQLQCRRAVEGLCTKKNQAALAVSTPTNTTSSSAAMQQHSDVTALNYVNYGVRPGSIGPNVDPNLNPAAVLMGQNLGFGFANPMLFSTLPPSVAATGLSPSLGAVGGNYGISYGSQAALQGLGAYQGAQLVILL